MKNWKECFIKLLEDNRGVVVVLFCLPASFAFDMFMKVWKMLFCIYSNMFGSHLERVKKIQKEVRIWNSKDFTKRKLLCNSRPNWLSLSTTFFNKSDCHKISIPLYQILSLNEDKATITVEPYVTVGEVTNFLLKYGYALACTLEISDATCGGLAMGVGMTTHSHVVGLFQETITSYGLVLGDGSHVVAKSDNEYSDLFYSLPWSHGSLAFLVSLELKIIPVKPYIRLRYRPVLGLENYCNQIRHYSGAHSSCHKDTPDFLEATVFSKEQAIIMLGNFSDEDKLLKVNAVSSWYKPWFYKHVESFLQQPVNTDGFCGDELIPIKDYLFRHNRSIFWVLEAIIPFCNNWLFRFFFGQFCPPKPAFLKFTSTQRVRELTFLKQVFQDIILPMTVLEDSIIESEKLFDIYPILIYPCKIFCRNQEEGLLRNPRHDQLTPNKDYGMFYDLGVYGIPGFLKSKQFYNPAAAMRKMEKFIRDNGGYSFLYADIFLNRYEFTEMFNLFSYEKVRKKYHAENAFPHVYEKVKPECDVLKISEEFVQKFSS